jgi:hypothetical protein
MSAELLSVVVGASVAALLGATLAIALVTLRTPATTPMAIASVLVGIALVAMVAIRPLDIPDYIGAVIAVLGIAAATVGGNPFARRALAFATGKRVRETEDGGILIIAAHASGAEDTRTLMRGGTVIGYLERAALVVSIAVGFPEAIAAIIAVKGIGRFPELAESEARERFIIGTVASLLWSGAIGAVIRLALI